MTLGRSRSMPAAPVSGVALVDGLLQRTELANGVVIVSEMLPGAPVSGTGLWLRRGSSCEQGWPGGITHLLEHMNFKGTSRRDALEISAAIEGRGGSLNASTGRGSTSFYTNSLSEDWTFCLEILAEMLLDSVYAAEELDKEKAVILDEIRMVEEAPEEELYDLAFLDLFPDSPWGQPVQGTEASVAAVDRVTLRRFADSCLHGGELVVAVAGGVEHEALVRRCETLFGALPPGRACQAPEPVPGRRGRHDHRRAGARQAHLQLGSSSPARADLDYDAVAFLNTLLGDGMSSRLFQELRERRALCYSVYAWLEGLGRGGAFGAYLACEASRVAEAEALCLGEFARLAEEGPRDEEIERTRRQLRGGLLIGQEQNLHRMVQLARAEIRLGRLQGLGERIGRLEGLDSAQLKRVAREWFDPARFCITRLLPKGRGASRGT
jgi:predicted Zn-dependent peptidase